MNTEQTPEVERFYISQSKAGGELYLELRKTPYGDFNLVWEDHISKYSGRVNEWHFSHINFTKLEAQKIVNVLGQLISKLE